MSVSKWHGCLLFAGALFSSVLAAQTIALTQEEKKWLDQNPTATMCVDPDWMPFERINANKQVEGIGADLVKLVASRAGLSLKLVPTVDWPQSIEASKAGRCQVLAFLNQTPERSQWLNFTAPLLTEPNVVITREDHGYVTTLDGLSDETLALPKGTSVEERIRANHPALRILLTDTEEQALAAVADRKADLTIRSLNVAAYTIRKEGLFMLKIAGQIPAFENRLSMGIGRDYPYLYAILDKAARTITPLERERIINQHVFVNVVEPSDRRLLLAGLTITLAILAIVLLWVRQSHRAAQQCSELTEMNLQFKRREIEVQHRLVAMLSHELRTPVAIIAGATKSVELLLPQRTEELQLRLDRIQAGVARIVVLTDQFLLKDRVDQGTVQLHCSYIDLETLSLDAMHLLDSRRLQFYTAAEKKVVWADGSLIQVAIENLMRNALQYAKTETPIRIQLRYDAANWICSVRNEGECIPHELVDTIFEPYFRGAKQADRSGAGIGLYVVQRVAMLHKGTVDIAQNSDGIVEFVLRIPHIGAGVSSAAQA